MQDPDFLDLRLVFQILQPRLDFESRRRNGGEGPLHVVRLLRENRAQHHRNFRSRHKRRGGEIAGGNATAREDIDLVGADHLAIAGDRLLRLGAVVLDDEIDLAAHNAALCIERGNCDLDAVTPCAIHGRGVASKAGRHADLVGVLRAGARERE